MKRLSCLVALMSLIVGTIARSADPEAAAKPIPLVIQIDDRVEAAKLQIPLKMVLQAMGQEPVGEQHSQLPARHTIFAGLAMSMAAVSLVLFRRRSRVVKTVVAMLGTAAVAQAFWNDVRANMAPFRLDGGIKEWVDPAAKQIMGVRHKNLGVSLEPQTIYTGYSPPLVLSPPPTELHLVPQWPDERAFDPLTLSRMPASRIPFDKPSIPNELFVVDGNIVLREWSPLLEAQSYRETWTNVAPAELHHGTLPEVDLENLRPRNSLIERLPTKFVDAVKQVFGVHYIRLGNLPPYYGSLFTSVPLQPSSVPATLGTISTWPEQRVYDRLQLTRMPSGPFHVIEPTSRITATSAQGRPFPREWVTFEAPKAEGSLVTGCILGMWWPPEKPLEFNDAPHIVPYLQAIHASPRRISSFAEAVLASSKDVQLEVVPDGDEITLVVNRRWLSANYASVPGSSSVRISD